MSHVGEFDSLSNGDRLGEAKAGEVRMLACEIDDGLRNLRSHLAWTTTPMKQSGAGEI
jgi:hypothetical protein